MKAISAVLSAIFIASFSCSPDKSSDVNHLPDYEMVIVDSIQVDHLGSLVLLDIHEEKELFLFSSEDDNRLFLTNKSGEIINTFEEPGDSPTAVGSNTGSGTFVGDQIVIMGRNRYAVYDLDFNFDHGFKLSYQSSGMFYLGFDYLQKVLQNGKAKLLAFTGGAQTDSPSNQPEYYKNYNTFDLINIDSGTFTPVVPFHPQSRFLSGEAFDFIAPIFQVDGNEISFVHKRDTLLYSYNLDQPDSFTAMRIPFDKFILKKGYPMKGQMDYETPSEREATINSYFKVGDLNIFTYSSGIKLEDMPDMTLERDSLFKVFGNLNPQKWIVMDENGLSSIPQTIFDKFRLSRTDSKGYIWAAQNIYVLDEEPDMVTYYKLKLTEK